MDIYEIPVGEEDPLAVAVKLEGSLEGLGDWFWDLLDEFQSDLIAALTIYREQRETVKEGG